MEHHHHHHAPAEKSRALGIGIGLNLLFIAAEIGFGVASGSLSLIADAGHNASDVLGLALAWGAVLLAARKVGGRFTYGLQGASILAALANALLLFAALGGIGWEAIDRFHNPQPVQTGMVVWVALAGVVVNGITAYMLSHDHHDLNMRGAFLHMVADAAISLGVAASALLTAYTGWLWLDAATSLVIVLIIAISSWKLFSEAVLLTLGAAPQQVPLEEVRATLSQLPGVAHVHDLHVWAISTSGTALSAHLVMPGGHPGDAFLHHILHLLEERFHIGHATIQIELGEENVHPHTKACDHDH